MSKSFPTFAQLSALFGNFEMLQRSKLMTISKRSPTIINPVIAKDCLFQFLLMEIGKMLRKILAVGRGQGGENE